MDALLGCLNAMRCIYRKDSFVFKTDKLPVSVIAAKKSKIITHHRAAKKHFDARAYLAI